MTDALTIHTIAKGKRGDEVRISLAPYKGVDRIDIRTWCEISKTSGVLSPTKQGVSLPIVDLPELIQALQAAEQEARRCGMLPEPQRLAS